MTFKFETQVSWMLWLPPRELKFYKTHTEGNMASVLNQNKTEFFTA